MLEVALHVGTEHPNMAWIVIPSILTFIGGLAIGRFGSRIRSFFGDDAVTSE